MLLTATVTDPPDLAEFHEPRVVNSLPKSFALADLLESIRSAVAKRDEGSRQIGIVFLATLGVLPK